MSVTTEMMPDTFVADSTIVKAIVASVNDCLTMCDSRAKCVSVSTVPVRESGAITGIIGVHGDVSGFVTVNLAETVARATVGGLLQDRFDRLSPQVIDGVGEIANIVAGGIKKGLASTRWAFSNVTVPSVIVGQNYHIAFAKGLEYVSVTFEHANEDSFMLDERLLNVAVSLIRL